VATLEYLRNYKGRAQQADLLISSWWSLASGKVRVREGGRSQSSFQGFG